MAARQAMNDAGNPVMTSSIYLPPSLSFSPRRMAFSTWVDHLPFGYDLVGALRPSVLVELGTQSGVSYFCLCQSLREHGVTARAYAVDTWEGDEHTDHYDEKVFAEVKAHNDAHYADFSTLLRKRFEEAVGQFAPESIGLVHIDGYHTYEAVQGDFETWYPKVEPGGIVLFHDVMAKIRDFGAWRFWEDLEKNHETFLFRHGFGLGVLRKPGPVRRAPLLDFLFSKDREVEERLRGFYVHAAEFQELRRKHERIEILKQAVRERRAREAAETDPQLSQKP
jgi:hypothetical protein